MQRREFALGASAAALAGCVALDPPSLPNAAPAPADMPPAPPREFRAAWVATVAHIDWPSAPGLSSEQQRAEALAIIERARAIGLNALILQVRPAGDTLYPSTLEPWSELLSGTQGQPPQPPWDPLAFWVREAHARALELHAWFNPFRARHSSAKSPAVAPHRAVTHPAQVKRYGDQLWMDPGDEAAAEHSLAVVADVLRRYDVDGVHIDDYFYPYPVPSAGAGSPDVPFPDDDSYARYRLAGGALARDDWRRDNVDRYVRRLYELTRSIKPWVRVGVSPFGVGRPDRRPAGISGFSQYDKLYADVEKWLAQGWLDYLAPQLYWQVNREGLQFPLLLDQWVLENTQQRHLWPGLFTSLVRDAKKGEPLSQRVWPAQEIVSQIALQRQRGEKAGGHIHFSMVALMQDRDGLATRLREGPYAQAALTPATPWLAEPTPAAVRLQREGAKVRIEGAAGAARWALWQRGGNGWQFAVLPAQQRHFDAAADTTLAVAAVGRTGILGPWAWLKPT